MESFSGKFSLNLPSASPIRAEESRGQRVESAAAAASGETPFLNHLPLLSSPLSLPFSLLQQTSPMTDKCRVLWDQLACLWVCIVLNPHASSKERRAWRSMLEKWAKLGSCPLEDYEFTRSSLMHSSSLKRRISAIDDSSDEDEADVAGNNDHNNNNNNNNLNLNLNSGSSHNASGSSNNRYNSSNNHNDRHRSSSHRSPSNSSSSGNYNSSHRNLPPPPRSIFQRALDACHLRWDDAHLRFILDHDSYPVDSPTAQHSSCHMPHGYPLWTSGASSPVSPCCLLLSACMVRDAGCTLALDESSFASAGALMRGD